MLRLHDEAPRRGGSGGAFLFADIRGSTALAERLSSSEYHDLLERYFATATSAVFKYDGFVDKFVGDELVALFYPLLTGERFAERAVDAAKEVLRATGHGDPGGPWVPVGAGVHSGLAWFGSVGEGTHVEMTAVGMPSTSPRAWRRPRRPERSSSRPMPRPHADLDPTLARHALELKGKELPTDVVSIRVSPD